VINHGELVEQGSHDELLAIGGLYSQLYDAQTRIRSRTQAEGGAGHEGQLIDTISQEVGERIYGARGNGHPVEPAQLDEPPIETPAVEPEPITPEPGAGPAESVPATPEPPPAPPAREPAIASGNGDTQSEFVGPRPLASLNEDGISGRNGRFAKNRRAARDEQARAMVKILGESDDRRCDFCGRTLLKGEHVEPFVAPYGSSRRKPYDGQLGETLTSLRRMQGADLEHKLVCELCWSPAEEAGWAPLPVVGGRR
jgi:hypothetical protein